MLRKSMVILITLFVAITAVTFSVLADDGSVRLLDLSAYFNNDAISYSEDPLDGDIDFLMRSLPAEHLPESGELISFQGAQFIFPPKEDGKYNNIAAYNQQILVPRGAYHDLYVIATATNGPQKDVIELIYSDGTPVRTELRISQGSGAPVFGEQPIFSVDYMHGILGVMNQPMNLWVVSVPIDPTRELEAVHLPENPNLHIFAATLGRMPHLVTAKTVIEEELFTLADPVGDDYGPGSYTYPTNAIFAKGTFDIVDVKLVKRDDDYVLKVTVDGVVENGWGGPHGISAHLLHVYFDLGSGDKNQAIPGANVAFAQGRGWQKAVIHEGGWDDGAASLLFELAPELVEHVLVTKAGWVEGQTINIPMPHSFLGDFHADWGIQVLMLGQEGSAESMDGVKVRRVLASETEWQFGGGDDRPGRPNVIDMLTAMDRDQSELLGEYKATGTYPLIPLIYPMR